MTSLYQNNRACQTKASGNLALSLGGWLIGGLGIGAIVMYFLDPDAGSNRRQGAVRLATQAASQAGQSLGKVKDTIVNAAQADSVGDAVEQISDALPHHEKRSSPLMPIAITAIACSLLGAAVMYVLDPDSGPRRRGYLREQATSSARGAAETAVQKSKHLRNKAQGLYHEATKMVQSSRFAGIGGDDNRSGPE